jgi:hypothetical protein
MSTPPRALREKGGHALVAVVRFFQPGVHV